MKINGLEHLVYTESQKQVGLLSLEKGVFPGGSYQCVLIHSFAVAHKNDGARLFSVVPRNR